MLYPAELITKNDMLGDSAQLRREVKFYEEFFGCDPRHVGGEYDIAHALRICQFAKAYHVRRVKHFWRRSQVWKRWLLRRLRATM
jgi:hypothetical protein